MKKNRFILVILIFVLIVCQVSSIAYASLDANDVEDFDNNYTKMNQYRMWSVFKGLGMNDNQAVAALACSQCESNYRPEQIEIGINNSHAPLGNTMEDYQKYVELYSSKMDTDASMRTQFTDEVMKLHGLTDEQIEKAKKGELKSAQSNRGYSLSLSTYYINGVGYLGCGLYQYTGEGLRKLFEWSKAHNSRWFQFKNQMAFFIAPVSNKGYKGERLQLWISESKEQTLLECVDSFAKALINGSMPESQLATRRKTAEELYKQFAGKDYDKDYAKQVIAFAGIIQEESAEDAVEDPSKIVDRSIISSYASIAVRYTQNKGFLLDSNDDLKTANEKVFQDYIRYLNGTSTVSQPYSLFELFGEDVHWYRYFGEATVAPNLLDHIWSGIDQDKTDQLVTFDTIFYEPQNYLSCQVYATRPTVLTKDDVNNGNIDPRVSALSNGWFNGVKYVLGSIKLTISKYFVSFCALLLGPTIRNALIDAIDFITSTDLWKVIGDALKVILTIVMVFFIFSFVGKARNYAKGTGSAKDAIGRFIFGVIYLGLFYFALARPEAFTKITLNVVHVIDNMFDETLADAIDDDEVIAVQDKSKAIHAVLWKKSIFGPWVRGQFGGANYDELYTQFAVLEDGQKAMPQSNDNIDSNDGSGRIFYNSVNLTGDVYVPVGGNKLIRNWAAYLYSCGTIYHIDYTLNESIAETIDPDMKPFFPNETLKTTANNININADLFRIIDAQMDISPQYYADGTYSENYTKAKSLQTEFDKQSTNMLLNSAMIIFIFPVVYQKLSSLVLLYIIAFKLLFYTLTELFKEGSGGFKPFFDGIKKAFFNYILASFKICLMITLFYLLIDEGFLKLIVYIICCLVLLSFNLKDVKRNIDSIKTNAKRIKQKIW